MLGLARQGLMRWLRLLVAALALAACVAAPIDRADRAAEARIEQAATEARQIAEDAVRRLDDVRAAGVADLAERLNAARAATLADVDARLTAQRAAAVADVERVVAPVRDELAAVRAESAEWRTVAARAADESAAWRSEVAAWRAEAASLRAAFTGDVRAGSPAAPTDGAPAPLDPADRYALWAALAGAVFTVGKSGVRLWRARGAATPDPLA